MKAYETLTAVVGSIVMFALMACAVVRAHPMTHQGTVLTVQPTRVQIKVVDEKTKKEDSLWFIVNKNTKVKRGEQTVTYTDAKITIGERIVIIVDMDAETKMVATEIRLAQK
jgi:hypothetical protein